MELGKSLEDYLEAILVLKNKNGTVHSVELARYMNFSKPSISHATKELRKKGYLDMETDGNLKLTEEGQAIAEKIYERHLFFKEQLMKAGVDLANAERDACRIEHAISEESFQKLKASVQEKKEEQDG